MTRRLLLLVHAVLLLLLTPVAAIGDDEERAARRAAADKVVLLGSATPATGPLPAATPLSRIRFRPGLWREYARDRVKQVAPPAVPGGKGGAPDDIDPDPIESDPIESDDDLPFEESKPEKKAYDIPSLDAQVTSLRFYEGGMDDVPVDRRAYQQRFASESTRAIWWELGLAHPAPGRKKEFRIDARWRRQDGSVYAQQVIDTHLGAGWTSSLHSKGRGASRPASWERGTYSVELTIDGKVVASGTFDVTSPARLSNVQLHHNQIDPHGQKGVQITFQLETWGRLGKETHVSAHVQFADGTPLKDMDGQYADDNKLVATRLEFHPKYESARWKQARMFIPYAQMHLARGKHDLLVVFMVFDPYTGAVLAYAPSLQMSVTWN